MRESSWGEEVSPHQLGCESADPNQPLLTCSECVKWVLMCLLFARHVVWTPDRRIWIFSSSGRLNSAVCSVYTKYLDIWCQHLLSSSRKCFSCYGDEKCMYLFSVPQEGTQCWRQTLIQIISKKTFLEAGWEILPWVFLLLWLLFHSLQGAVLNKIKYD